MFITNSKQLHFVLKFKRSLFLINSPDHCFLLYRHLDDIKLKKITQDDVPGIESIKEIILKTLIHLKFIDLKIKHHFLLISFYFTKNSQLLIVSKFL